MQPKRNLVKELYFQLNGIRAVADSMTNMCVAYAMPVDTQNQIHGIEQSITALTEKAEKLVSEIEAQAAYGTEAPSEKLPNMGNMDTTVVKPQMYNEKPTTIVDMPEQANADTLSDLHDQATHVAGLVKAADTMIVAACIDGNGLYSVITTLKADTQKLCDNLEAVA